MKFFRCQVPELSNGSRSGEFRQGKDLGGPPLKISTDGEDLGGTSLSGEGGARQGLFSGGTLNIGWGGRCTVTNRCSDNLSYGRGCSRIPGGDSLNLQRRRGFSRFAPVRSPQKFIHSQKKFPGAGPRAYRICNTVCNHQGALRRGGLAGGGLEGPASP